MCFCHTIKRALLSCKAAEHFQSGAEVGSTRIRQRDRSKHSKYTGNRRLASTVEAVSAKWTLQNVESVMRKGRRGEAVGKYSRKGGREENDEEITEMESRWETCKEDLWPLLRRESASRTDVFFKDVTVETCLQKDLWDAVCTYLPCSWQEGKPRGPVRHIHAPLEVIFVSPVGQMAGVPRRLCVRPVACAWTPGLCRKWPLQNFRPRILTFFYLKAYLCHVSTCHSFTLKRTVNSKVWLRQAIFDRNAPKIF